MARRRPLNLSAPAALADAYAAAVVSDGLPPLSALLQRAMVAELEAHGLEVPPAPANSQTAAATAASTAARLQRPGR